MDKIAYQHSGYRKALIFTCFVIAGFISGCASTGSSNVSAADLQKRQQALAKSDLLIVPGQRIGPIRIGMAWDEVLATLGEPDYQYVNPGDHLKIPTQMWYASANLQVYFTTSATPTVTSVRTITFSEGSMPKVVMWADLQPVVAPFKTAEGIGLGASSFEVARVYGAYEAIGVLGMKYEQRNMLFAVTQDRRVYSILITPF